MVFFGLVRFSYYRWQRPLLRRIVSSEWFQGIERARFAWLLLVSAPLVFLISTLSYVLVEVPGMRFRRGSGRARF